MKKTLLDNEKVLISLEAGILSVTGKEHMVDINVVQSIVDYRLSVSEGKEYPLLINVIPVKNITKEARDFLASKKGCEGVIAAGILIDSVIGSMIGNFFISVNRPLVPTKIFTGEEEAKKWLTNFARK